MSRVSRLLLAVGFVAVVGCGSSQPPMNTAPLTDAQKAAMKAQDQKVDEEENAANTKKKKR